jgi:dTDP-4-dehydrorhamnose 3,5-epimerase
MKLEKTPLDGLLVVTLDIYGDERGFFVERFNESKFKELGLPTNFVQDNHSRSSPGVLRGLHCQHTPPQAKLVGVVRGRIWDVAVDIRSNSPNFGQYFAIELTDINGKLLWIPEGFAHGFCVLGDEVADVFYKTTALFSPQGESGIIWDDPDIAINWPIKNAIISKRDQTQQSLKEYLITSCHL